MGAESWCVVEKATQAALQGAIDACAAKTHAMSPSTAAAASYRAIDPRYEPKKERT